MMELFVTIVKGFQPLANVAKNSFLDIAKVLDLPLKKLPFQFHCYNNNNGPEINYKNAFLKL